MIRGVQRLATAFREEMEGWIAGLWREPQNQVGGLLCSKKAIAVQKGFRGPS